MPSPPVSRTKRVGEGRGAGIHFIGIGGIGMSALARLYRSRGIRVSGSDIERSEITDALRREGIRVVIGPHRRASISPGATGVIRTSAVRDDNPEVREAKKRGLVARFYAEALGGITREYRSIAIAGAHGKSTTTALVALVLIRGGLDPSVVVGTKLREFGDANFRRGRSAGARGQPNYLVFEADEYRDAFLNAWPAIAVITNIDREHLDFHRNLPAIERAFEKFLRRLSPGGAAILNRDSPNVRRVARRLRQSRRDIRIIWYSLRDPEARILRKTLLIPGEHNISNALAAFRVGTTLHIPRSTILKAVASYRGSWRRFDYQGKFLGANVFADYAHHPTEIKATLQAAREKFPKRRIVAVFQPHHYERLKHLFKEFAGAFRDADLALFLDVYEVAGREERQKRKNISSAALARAVAEQGTEAHHLGRTLTRANLRPHLRSGDILLLMGAGSIWDMTKRLVERR